MFMYDDTSYQCPITLETLIYPVFASDGFVYEHKTIQRWLQSNKTSPTTNKTLEHIHVSPCFYFEQKLEDYKRKGPTQPKFNLSDEYKFTCILTKNLFETPVLAADGFFYEEKAILDWFKNHNTSPTTQQPISHTFTIRVFFFKKELEIFKELYKSNNIIRKNKECHQKNKKYEYSNILECANDSQQKLWEEFRGVENKIFNIGLSHLYEFYFKPYFFSHIGSAVYFAPFFNNNVTNNELRVMCSRVAEYLILNDEVKKFYEFLRLLMDISIKDLTTGREYLAGNIIKFHNFY
jgi:hypothetical protein